MTIEADQKHFDRAYEEREARRSRLLSPEAAGAAIHPGAAVHLRKKLRQSAENLRGSDEAVAFGRTDDELGDTFYIGYDLITDDDREPLVISWQSDRGSRYSQATRQDPMGLLLKRIFETSINTITGHHDERFGEAEVAPVTDPFKEYLLHELAGHRSGRMKDVVRTLQAHQDHVMRMPADQVLVVKGGPGTGKTIVGLQRISVLLYRDDVEIDEVAFIGPTPGYLKYVSSVLPALGAADVRHLSITGLAPGTPRIRSRDDPRSVRVKGDKRMRELITRAVALRRRAPEEATEFTINGHAFHLESNEIWSPMRILEESGVPYNIGRQRLSEQLASAIVDQSAESRTRTALTVDEVRQAQNFQNLMNRIWPRISPPEALRDLLSSQRRLTDLSWNLFDKDEISVLFRPAQQRLSDERWSTSDIALLDGFADELAGVPEQRYRHIVVDEVQDLSPMQLASVARRSSNGAFTLLGDLGQGFGPFARTSWSTLLDDLGLGDAESTVSLDISYRVPKSMMDLAGTVAAEASIPITVPTAIREDGGEPVALRVAAAGLLKAVVAETRQHLSDGHSVGVIASDIDISAISSAFDDEGIVYVDGRQDLDDGVTIIPATDVSGLEFDACVIVEPGRIASEVSHGLNLIYVTLTRATKRLSIVYSDDLPGPLSGRFPVPVDDREPVVEVHDSVPEEPAIAPQSSGTDQLGEEPAFSSARIESDVLDFERPLTILRLIAEGHTYEQILASMEDATYVEIFNAAELGRDALTSSRRRDQPPRSGISWEVEEDDQLVEEITAGLAVISIAEAHQRSRGAITARINKLVARRELPPEYLVG